MHYPMNEPEIDMEELEAHLYGQIYHAANDGNEDTSDTKASSSTVPSELHGKTFGRYFEENKKQPFTYNPQDMHRSYQKPQNRNHSYFQANPNPFQPLYKNYGLVTLPELVLNPAVNNIVVLPPPPTQIFTQEPANEKMLEKFQKMESKREKLRIKRREKQRIRKRTKRLREKAERLATEQNEKAFKEHHLSRQVEIVQEENKSPDLEISKSDEVICLSESDNSDCEELKDNVTVVLVSSDDEGNASNSLLSIKYENVSNVKVRINTNNQIPKQLQEDPKQDNHKVDIHISSEQQAEEDDVILVESSEQNEVITIDWEDSQTNVISSEMVQNTVIDPNSVVSDKKCQEQKEVLDTPESTTLNDFLDSTLNLSQHNFDDLNIDISHASGQRCADTCETESSCSTNDLETTLRSTIFNEEAFDTPSKELNLDSFTDYIVSKGNTSTSIPSILTPSKSGSTKTIRGISINSKSNSSDSSSESDYETNKCALIEKNLKNQKVKQGKSTNIPSENTSLPNLSPMTSDEEIDVVEIESERSDTQNKKQKKLKNVHKDSEQTENVPIYGEKRKAIELNEVTDNKKSKQNEDDLIQNQISPETTEPIIDVEATSSDEFSAVEIDSCGSYKGDIELLNISSTSNSSNPPQKKSNKKHPSFSDYWTDDMKKFYFESWGDEHFDVQERQRTMSDDPRMWKIIEKDRINVNLIPKGPRCHRCREFGHKSVNCTKRLDLPKCILCGARGHLETRCPNKVCTSCGRRSYYSTTYCSRCSNTRYAVCRICRMRGHTASNCTDLWRRYHLTTEMGPVMQPTHVTAKAPKDRWCSGCASRGHFEHDCNYYNRTHLPANPFVYSYEDVYESNSSGRKNYISKNQTRYEKNDDLSNRNVNTGNQLSNVPVSSNIINNFKQQNRVHVQEQSRNVQVHSLFSGFQPNPNFINLNSYNQNFIPIPNVFGPNCFQQLPIQQPVNIPSLMQLQIPLPATLDINQENVEQPQTTNIPPFKSHIEEKAESNNLNQNIESSGYSSNNSNNATKSSNISSCGNTDESSLHVESVYAFRLLATDGIEFLKQLSKETCLDIKMNTRNCSGSTCYVCVLQGPDDQKPKAKQAIEEFCKSLLNKRENANKHENVNKRENVITAFSTHFSIKSVKENISKLNDPNVKWLELAFKSSRSVGTMEMKLKEHEKLLSRNNFSTLKQRQKSEDALKSLEQNLRYKLSFLNAIVFGKFRTGQGAKHMEILEQWIESGTKNQTDKEVRKSFYFVFNNVTKHFNYPKLLKKYSGNESLRIRASLEQMLKNTIMLDKRYKNNNSDLVKQLENSYKFVILNNYSSESITVFKNLYRHIKKLQKAAAKKQKQMGKI